MCNVLILEKWALLEIWNGTFCFVIKQINNSSEHLLLKPICWIYSNKF